MPGFETLYPLDGKTELLSIRSVIPALQLCSYIKVASNLLSRVYVKLLKSILTTVRPDARHYQIGIRIVLPAWYLNMIALLK